MSVCVCVSHVVRQLPKFWPVCYEKCDLMTWKQEISIGISILLAFRYLVDAKLAQLSNLAGFWLEIYNTGQKGQKGCAQR